MLQGRLPVGTMVAFIGYTFTLTFAVQGLVNTLADVRTALAAVERINSVGRQGRPDAALAVGLDRCDGNGNVRKEWLVEPFIGLWGLEKLAVSVLTVSTLRCIWFLCNSGCFEVITLQFVDSLGLL